MWDKSCVVAVTKVKAAPVLGQVKQEQSHMGKPKEYQLYRICQKGLHALVHATHNIGTSR